jgi:L-ascorbate metabolism protein UlaG (beta-lactamase superfamily)
MRVEWHGQSAFTLTGDDGRVFIDPFGDMASLARDRGMQWEYPPIAADDVDLLLVTHEHIDHNGTDGVDGNPTTLRATAGTHESPIGEVTGIASEHDDTAGTQRGPNTIFVFDLDGVRVAHFGDFGQTTLRDEQAAAIGEIDLLIIPVGAGPTIGADQAAEIVARLRPRWVVPMHYRTPRISFLETADAFLAQMDNVRRLGQPAFDTADLESNAGPLVVVPAAP